MPGSRIFCIAKKIGELWKSRSQKRGIKRLKLQSGLCTGFCKEGEGLFVPFCVQNLSLIAILRLFLDLVQIIEKFLVSFDLKPTLWLFP